MHMVNFYHLTEINIPEEILMEPIFLNTRFKIEKRVFHFEDWIAKDVFLWKMMFFFFSGFQEKFHTETWFLKFYGCISLNEKYLHRNNIVTKTELLWMLTKLTLQLCSVCSKRFRSVLLEWWNWQWRGYAIHKIKLCMYTGTGAHSTYALW